MSNFDAMKTISMSELKRNAGKAIKRLARERTMLLTYRGKPAAQLTLANRRPPKDDIFYRLADFAVPMGSLTNEEIDVIVYTLP
jgi:antitoxin (DNA-binding transcriptional repressor) of toxin-antitoxin stability system